MQRLNDSDVQEYSMECLSACLYLRIMTSRKTRNEIAHFRLITNLQTIFSNEWDDCTYRLIYLALRLRPILQILKLHLAISAWEYELKTDKDK